MGHVIASGPGPVALDTVAFIYFIERHPVFLPLVKPLFAEIDAGRLLAVTSVITLLEALVVPYRRNDVHLASQYEALLTRSRGLHLVEIDRPLVRSAAQLRAAHGLRTPDALQLAAALATRCSAFVTNDRRLPRVRGLKIVQLADYAAKP